MQQGAAQKPVHGTLREQIGVRDLERAEDGMPQQARGRDPVDPPAGDPARLDEPQEGDRELGAARRAGDPGGRREHDSPHERRVPLGKPKRDDAAERVPEHVRRTLEKRGEGVRVAAERGRRRQGRRASVPREIRHDQAPPLEQRRQFGEVPRRTAEAVHQEQGRPLPAGEEADPGAAELVDPFREAREKICRIRHADRLWFEAE